MDAINLNAGVTIKKLYKDLDADKIKKIEDASADGFTEDELQKLENEGIDTSLIKKNSKDATNKKASVEDKAQEIKDKYCKNITATSNDAYSAKNPELTAFSSAIKDGLIQELSDIGYTKADIVDIINQAFPSIGIKNSEDGNYTCPYGHGQEAKEIYNDFVSKLTQATSVDPAKMNEAREKLTKISSEITNNNRALKSLEYNITLLQDEIEDKINDAIEESEDVAQSQKEEAKNIVKKRLNEYTNSNGEMSYQDFQKNVSNDLSSTLGDGVNSKLADAVSKITSAQRDMCILSGYMSKMKDLIDSNAKLSDEAKDIQKEIADIKEKATDDLSSDESCKRCDPIGFSDSEGVRYDFFVDKDSDGNVTNENEFLGAENGFKEMIEADSDKDGKVSASELDNKNVKVVVTKSDGTQEIKDASDIFKDGDNIDLSSYQAQNQELNNGNALLGTFSVNKDGKTLDTGYQTLDKLDWLDDNFEFSDEINGKGRHINKEGAVSEALDYTQKYNVFSQKFAELQSKETKAELKLGLDSAEIKNEIKTSSEKEASKKAEKIQNVFNHIQTQSEEDETENIEKTEKTEDEIKTEETEKTEKTEKTEEIQKIQPQQETTEINTEKNDIGINGKIDEAIMQGKNGDCWILSSVLSLNSTAAGKKVISDAIKANPDGSVTVTFKGANKSYTISKDEIKKYDTDNIKNDNYVNGDNDMLAIELATEKLYKDVQDGSLVLNDYIINYVVESDKNGIEGGNQNIMHYLMTGNDYKNYRSAPKTNENNQVLSYDSVSKVLSEAAKNQPSATTFNLSKADHSAKLTNGKTYSVNLGTTHALSVQNIDAENKTVSFVNSWDSSKEYTMSWDEFTKLGISYIGYGVV